MIFVVILIAAATTIIASSVDLSRMAAYKQHQSEREANWQYSIESAKAIVTENLTSFGSTTQSFSQTINGMLLTIGASPNDAWNATTGTQISVTGNLEGNSRTSKILIGKRTYVNPFLFGMYFTGKFNPNNYVTLDSDLFLPSIYDITYTRLSGDCYASQATRPTFNTFSGAFYGRQPVEKFQLNDGAYASNATISTVGNITLKNPTNLLSLTSSQLRYHEGNLTITGTVLGEITIFVKGGVYFDNVKVATSVLSRLVVICDGDINFEPGTSYVFAIGNGRCRMSGGTGDRIIFGSIAADELTATNFPWTITYDNSFSVLPNLAARYWLPGQW